MKSLQNGYQVIWQEGCCLGVSLSCSLNTYVPVTAVWVVLWPCVYLLPTFLLPSLKSWLRFQTVFLKKNWEGTRWWVVGKVRHQSVGTVKLYKDALWSVVIRRSLTLMWTCIFISLSLRTLIVDKDLFFSHLSIHVYISILFQMSLLRYWMCWNLLKIHLKRLWQVAFCSVS